MNDRMFVEFFQISCEATSRLAADALRLAGRQVTGKNITLMLATAPRNETESISVEFSDDSFCCQCLADARLFASEQRTPDDEALYQAVRHHFLSVVPRLSPETRQLLEAAFLGTMCGVRHAETSSLASREPDAVGVIP